MIKRFGINTLLAIGLISLVALFVNATDSTDYKNVSSNLPDPIFQDYIGTAAGYLSLPQETGVSDFKDSPGPVKTGLKNVFLSSNKDGLYSTVIKLQAKKKVEPKPNLVFTVAKLKSSTKKASSINPLFYKVRFANETGRIDSRVLPLDSFDSYSHMNYAFVQILLKGEDSSDFVDKIAKEALFKFAGERKVLSKTGRVEKILILGWVPYNGFNAISKDSNVIKVSFEESKIDFSAMTDISFVLKLPYQTDHTPFISSFLEDINKKTGFILNKTAPIEKNYSIMLVTGKVPIDKIRDVFQSPFVIQIKLAEQSI